LTAAKQAPQRNDATQEWLWINQYSWLPHIGQQFFFGILGFS